MAENCSIHFDTLLRMHSIYSRLETDLRKQQPSNGGLPNSTQLSTNLERYVQTELPVIENYIRNCVLEGIIRAGESCEFKSNQSKTGFTLTEVLESSFKQAGRKLGLPSRQDIDIMKKLISLAPREFQQEIPSLNCMFENSRKIPDLLVGIDCNQVIQNTLEKVKVADLVTEGDQYVRLKLLNEGIESYNEALRIDPDNLGCHLGKGKAWRIGGFYDRSIESYQKALEVSPNLKTALSGIECTEGQRAKNSGRNGEAIEYFNRALEIDPVNISALINKGIALNTNNQKGLALASYNQAIKIDPSYSIPHFNRGLILLEMGLCSEAISSFDKTLNLQPTHTKAVRFKAISMMGSKDYEGFLKLMREHEGYYLSDYMSIGRARKMLI